MLVSFSIVFIEQKRPARVSTTDIADINCTKFRATTTTDMPGTVRSNPITLDSSEKEQIEINFDEELSYGILIFSDYI